jgi:hypothetical protein
MIKGMLTLNSKNPKALKPKTPSPETLNPKTPKPRNLKALKP